MPRLRIWVPVAWAALALAACGSTTAPRTQSAPAKPPPANADADLIVSVSAPDAVTHRVRCPGSRECARLARVDVSDFNRDHRAVCTQQYGGDWTATVRGTLAGRRLATDFSLRDGCEIARWQRFEWLLGRHLPQTATG